MPAAEKVADVQSANRMMASDAIRYAVGARAGSARVKRLMADLGGVLDRADAGRATNRRPQGDRARLPAHRRLREGRTTPADRRQDRGGCRSYQRAAGIAADIRSAEQHGRISNSPSCRGR